ncbi:hypothetical protein L0Z02_29710 (plasmid) [Burkholderia multivorans]|uniref:HNH endonuclease n=2 Tax=Burkholderia multivorans TaxID=87883 RepID=A0AAP2MRX6_9BURK|nr:hypothetical protein [Burkholderia multivorans]MBU9360766.1 hypothetical protein [Burkholderia multivorans]MCO1459890.1 hypothetical protein [Burkholderia multivorans]UQO21301.1 hypothetical protein L0Z02_29710 [Burkholderia multivorans]HEM7843227.1 hypothetical protein [Burkholderia multivorans]HEM7908548.1 hypothetical protein [Burkholderia multivorans]
MTIPMNEEPKRLTPTGQTLRELFLKSGNLCSFPNCGQVMMNHDGVFVGEVCHIEAAEKGGERFNEAMTNEERRQAANLMLMCGTHHKITNDVLKYPVWKLKAIKSEHEARFASPDRAMLEGLRDWTQASQYSIPRNLGRFVASSTYQYEQNEIQDMLQELADHIATFRLIPLQLREFFSFVVERAHRMRNTAVVRKWGWSGTAILTSDIEAAFRLSPHAVAQRVNQLEQYGILSLTEIDTDMGEQHGIGINSLQSGWPLWNDLAEFCEKMGSRLAIFAIDMDFGQLDD